MGFRQIIPHLVLLSCLAKAARVRINVGKVDGSMGSPLIFEPSSVTAKFGDTLDFHFMDENAAASIVRSEADSPCTPLSPGEKGFINSGFVLGEPTGVRDHSISAWTPVELTSLLHRPTSSPSKLATRTPCTSFARLARTARPAW
jgi:hypothetical protein